MILLNAYEELLRWFGFNRSVDIAQQAIQQAWEGSILDLANHDGPFWFSPTWGHGVEDSIFH